MEWGGVNSSPLFDTSGSERLSLHTLSVNRQFIVTTCEIKCVCCACTRGGGRSSVGLWADGEGVMGMNREPLCLRRHPGRRTHWLINGEQIWKLMARQRARTLALYLALSREYQICAPWPLGTIWSFISRVWCLQSPLTQSDSWRLKHRRQKMAQKKKKFSRDLGEWISKQSVCSKSIWLIITDCHRCR